MPKSDNSLDRRLPQVEKLLKQIRITLSLIPDFPAKPKMTYRNATWRSLVAAFTLVCLSVSMPAKGLVQEPILQTGESVEPPQPDGAVTVSSEQQTETNRDSIARGVVFSDVDKDGRFGPGDSAFVGIRVSNGKEIVVTDQNGRYEIPIQEGGAVFVIKPTGFRTALDANKLPRFFYLHKPNGSPQLKFPGSRPTGPLPQSIDFPLYQQPEPPAFKILLFGDPQPRNNTEVDYVAQDVVSELIGDKSAFGVTLGDIAFDNLDTFRTLNQTIALIGIPWYNVIGNHDLNLDATERENINETFEATYGPSYYSFDYGQVHFVVLDNIDWAAPTEKIQRWHYEGGLGEQQLDFLKKDLAMIPETQMVVLLMHIPIISIKDKSDFFKLIEKRPYCVSISGHTHDHRHLFLGKEDGFNGEKKHHHIVNVTVSGSWWSGARNDNQIPHATMTDGAPNGYSIMTFDSNGYRLDFKAAGLPASEQMRVHVAATVDTNETQNTDVWVNVFNGSEESTVKMSLDNDDEWIEFRKTLEPDPHFVDLWKRDEGVEPKLSKPKDCFHLWTQKLPAGILPGVHLIRIQTTDRHGRTYHAHRSIRVTGTQVPSAQATHSPEATVTGGEE